MASIDVRKYISFSDEDSEILEKGFEMFQAINAISRPQTMESGIAQKYAQGQIDKLLSIKPIARDVVSDCIEYVGHMISLLDSLDEVIIDEAWNDFSVSEKSKGKVLLFNDPSEMENEMLETVSEHSKRAKAAQALLMEAIVLFD